MLKTPIFEGDIMLAVFPKFLLCKLFYLAISGFESYVLFFIVLIPYQTVKLSLTMEHGDRDSVVNRGSVEREG